MNRRQIASYVSRVRQGMSRRELWLVEVAPVALLAIALPLGVYTKQREAVSYASELLLPLGLNVLLALGLAVVYHLTLRHRPARLLASLIAVFTLSQSYHDREMAAAQNVLAVFLLHKPTLVTVIIALAGSWLAGWALQRFMAISTLKVRTALLPVLLIAAYTVGAAAIAGFVRYQISHTDTALYTHSFDAPKLKPSPEAPDVYYLVFDRYANAQTLAEDYGFDNTEFLSALDGMGLQVRPDAYSNYQFTAPSMASTLNLNYLTPLQEGLQNETTMGYLPYRRLIENNAVQRSFAQAGYEVTNISSWFGPTRTMSEATNVNPRFTLTLFGRSLPLSDLQDVMLRESVFGTLFEQGLKLGPIQVAASGTGMSTRDLFFSQLAAVKDVATKPSAKPQFVVAHVISPHPPYMFLPDGSAATYGENDDNQGAQRSVKYINQLKFINSQILDLMNHIKSSAKRPPVIILQSDEGPYPPAFLDAVHPASGQEGGSFGWDKASAATLRHKTGILAAYHLPATAEGQTPAVPTSPVNAFRTVFNEYFGANLDPLPDCTFMYNDAQQYKFYDATAAIRGQANEACAKSASEGITAR